MRTFIAIDLPEAVRAALTNEQATLRRAVPPQQNANIRWTRPEGIHLTLKFLGEVQPDKLSPICASLHRLGPFAKFAARVRGFGFFPSARRPKVLWAGLEAPPALEDLARQVEKALEPLGFAPETRPFTPHLTLARFKIPVPQTALEELLPQRGRRDLQSFEVSEFFLFESRLKPGGAEYCKVARFPP